jgi:hypothetical protein
VSDEAPTGAKGRCIEGLEGCEVLCMQEQLYDIYGLWHVPFWQTTWFKLLVGSIIVAILFVIIVMLVHHRRARKKVLTSWEQALRDLHELREHGIPAPDRAQEFYLRLTEILKTYLQQRYQYSVIGKTDHELMHFLYQEHFSPALLQELQEIFSGIEVIKFARGTTVVEQIERDLQRSVLFVEQTILSESENTNR